MTIIKTILIVYMYTVNFAEERSYTRTRDTVMMCYCCNYSYEPCHIECTGNKKIC